MMVLVVAGVATHLALNAYRDREALAGLTDDTALVAITIADEALSVPANMIRKATARQGGKMDRVDLIIHWPSLNGFSDDASADFTESPPSPAILYATIAPRSTALDASERLDAVYAGFFTGKAVPGPAGLVGRTLDPASGYGGEVVFFSQDGAHPFVARCLADADANVALACMRDVNFGHGLSMLYRFGRERLADWAALDPALRERAAGFLAR